MKMATISNIIYKPHCGKCGFPIDTSEQEIEYQEIYEKFDNGMFTRKVGASIHPNKCARCGAFFDSIEVTPPKKLEDIYIE